MFSFVNPYSGVEPVKLPALARSEKRGYASIICCGTSGPSFGGVDGQTGRQSLDLKIEDKANESRSSFSCLGKGFQCPEGRPGDLFLTGSAKFPVADYEVFELHEW